VHPVRRHNCLLLDPAHQQRLKDQATIRDLQAQLVQEKAKKRKQPAKQEESEEGEDEEAEAEKGRKPRKRADAHEKRDPAHHASLDKVADEVHQIHSLIAPTFPHLRPRDPAPIHPATIDDVADEVHRIRTLIEPSPLQTPHMFPQVFQPGPQSFVQLTQPSFLQQSAAAQMQPVQSFMQPAMPSFQYPSFLVQQPMQQPLMQPTKQQPLMQPTMQQPFIMQQPLQLSIRPTSYQWWPPS
jgi:hypothetical protein